MSLGIECLLAHDHGKALELATKLERLNRERREIESEMQDSALAMLEGVEAGDAYTLAIHRAEWHTGVVGLLASRLKDRYDRPVFAFAAESGGRLKGSGRSIAGFHLRDALDLVDKRHPGLLERFGGHAAAAGATLRAAGLEEFRTAFEAVAREMLTPADLPQRIETDGGLPAAEGTAHFHPERLERGDQALARRVLAGALQGLGHDPRRKIALHRRVGLLGLGFLGECLEFAPDRIARIEGIWHHLRDHDAARTPGQLRHVGARRGVRQRHELREGALGPQLLHDGGADLRNAEAECGRG